MAATSKNKYDVHKWLIKVLDSCVSIAQWSSWNRMYANWRKVYYDYTIDHELDSQLRNKRDLWLYRKNRNLKVDE